jgi:hypothetical protein
MEGDWDERYNTRNALANYEKAETPESVSARFGI